VGSVWRERPHTLCSSFFGISIRHSFMLSKGKSRDTGSLLEEMSWGYVQTGQTRAGHGGQLMRWSPTTHRRHFFIHTTEKCPLWSDSTRKFLQISSYNGQLCYILSYRHQSKVRRLKSNNYQGHSTPMYCRSSPKLCLGERILELSIRLLYILKTNRHTG